MSEYYFSKMVNTNFEDTIEKIKLKLSKIGFGIVSEIDVSETFKKKLNIDFRKYRILGACHPATAYKAITAENKIGTMLPCNIIIQEFENGDIEIAAIDPEASMRSVKNYSLSVFAGEIHDILKNFVDDFD